MEDYKEKYKAAIERAKEELGSGCFNKGSIEYIFPELKVDNGEMVRKSIISHLQYEKLVKRNISDRDYDLWISWLGKVKDFDKQLEEAYKNSDEVQYKRGYDDGYLEGMAAAKKELEKQGKCEADCPQNHQDVNHPNGCITMEDFNGGEGFYKLNIEYLNKRQVEEIEEIVRTWNKDVDCGLCTSKEHCISIEKQDTIKDGNSIDPHFGKPITITKMVNDFANGDLQPSLLEIDAYQRGISDTLEKQGEQKSAWKPTKEQIDAFTHFVQSVGESGYASPHDNNTKQLYSLLNDLKGLTHQETTKKSEQVGWSEEDERLFNSIYNTLEGIALLSYEKELNWLKSIKERLQ